MAWHRTGRLKTWEYAPPIIEAFSETNQRILRRIAAVMLARSNDDLDVLVSDANDLTFSNCLGCLAFSPVSKRGQVYLEGSRWRHWLEGHLVLEPHEAEALIEELERGGHKLGVRLGYTPTRLDRWLQRTRDEFDKGIEFSWSLLLFFVALVSFGLLFMKKFGDSENTSFGYSFAASLVAGFLAWRIARALRKLVEAKIEERNVARWESWKRTLRAG